MTWEPLHAGWRLSDCPEAPDRKNRGGRGPGPTWRQIAMMHALSGRGDYLYVAVSPCGTVAKVGSARNPLTRLRGAQDILMFTRRAMVGRPVLVRAYPVGDNRQRFAAEREAHRFLAPDRLQCAWREWYRVGPRLRALVRRLDERYRDEVLDARFGARVDEEEEAA